MLSDKTKAVYTELRNQYGFPNLRATLGYCKCWYTYVAAYTVAADDVASIHMGLLAKLPIAEFMNYLLYYL